MRWDEAGPVPEDVEPTVLSYQEFLRRENLRAWYRRRREHELTGVPYPNAAARRPGAPAGPVA